MGSVENTKNHPFGDVPGGKLESLEGLLDQFRADLSPSKTNLMIGVYRTDEGQPYVLPSVKQAKEKMFKDSSWHHDYRGSHLGTQLFRDASAELFFGANSDVVREKRVVSMQALGASGACHMGALLLKTHYGPWKQTQKPEVFIPMESWTNHANIFTSQGVQAHFIPYFSPATRALDFPALIDAIASLPPCSVIVLQTGAQNPTGCDPSPSEWRTLATVFRQRGHFAFFDAAYPGFASGSIDQDLECLRLFAEQEVPLLLAATYSKCFGLYCERVGILSVVVPDQDVGARMETQMRLQARAETGAMPDFGSTIVEKILLDDELRLQWMAEVQHMASQLQQRRITLRAALERLETPGDWSHITDQKGMFSYIGLTAEQMTILRERYHVYIQDSGRLSIAGLNKFNIDHVANSIADTVKATSN